MPRGRYAQCRNCGFGGPLQLPWCGDCLRAFLKGVATAMGAGIGAALASRLF